MEQVKEFEGKLANTSSSEKQRWSENCSMQHSEVKALVFSTVPPFMKSRFASRGNDWPGGKSVVPSPTPD